MPALSDLDLYSSLKELSVIDLKELDQAFKLSQSHKLPLQKILLDKDLITDENLGRIMSELAALPYIDLSQTSIPDEVLKIIPEVVAKKHQVIAFDKDKNGLKVAVVNPGNREMVEFLEKKSGEKISLYLTTEKNFNEAVSLYKKDIQLTFADLLKEQVDVAGKSTIKDAPVAKIVDLLIEYAYINRSSDIHIEPADNESLIRFRIDGVLHDVLHLPKTLHDQVIARIKVLSRLRTDEHLSAQDGKMQMHLEEESVDIRVSIVPIVGGEKAVLRLLSSRARRFSINDLGMNEADLQKIREAFVKPYGMILSTGPTGSGKTTSIYAVLQILNTREKNIATIEDPVEYDIEGINQIQVNPKTNLTFADGLRAILRQDPNIIFVGEIRDKETAGIAVNSAMTGHLVLSTLHTNDASTALPRLIDMEIEPFLVASTVNIIIGQRLVRKICEKCRISQTLLPDDIKKYLSAELIKKHFGEKSEIRIYHGKGCPVCNNTGYLGRVGVFEVLVISDAVRQLIVAKADADQIEKKAVEEGMRTMLEDGLIKVVNGITTLEEVMLATKI